MRGTANWQSFRGWSLSRERIAVNDPEEGDETGAFMDCIETLVVKQEKRALCNSRIILAMAGWLLSRYGFLRAILGPFVDIRFLPPFHHKWPGNTI